MWFLKPDINKLRNHRNIPALLKALRHRDWRIRYDAASALGIFREPGVVEALVRVLRDRAGIVRGAAAGALKKIGDARAVEPLAEALAREPGLLEASSDLAIALASFRDPRAVAPLVALKSHHPDVVKALVDIGHPAVDFLIAAVLDRSAPPADVERPGDVRIQWLKARRAAAEALGMIGDPRAVQPLVDVLWEDDMRSVAEEALLKIGKPGRDALARALEDVNADVRRAAARVLDKTGLPDDPAIRARQVVAKGDWEAAAGMGSVAVDALIAELRIGNSTARIHAAEALGKIGDTRAIEPLQDALRREDIAVRKAVACALTLLMPGDVKAQAYNAVENRQWERASKLGAAAIEPLLRAATKGGHDVCQQARAALSQISDKEGLQELCKALREGSPETGWEAALALGSIADRSTTEALCIALGEGAPSVRVACARALGEIGDARAFEPLRNALTDDDWRVCTAAANALGQIGTQDDPLVLAWIAVVGQDWQAAEKLGAVAVAPLIKAFDAPRHSTRQQAALTLRTLYLSGRLDDNACQPILALKQRLAQPHTDASSHSDCAVSQTSHTDEGIGVPL